MNYVEKAKIKIEDALRDLYRETGIITRSVVFTAREIPTHQSVDNEIEIKDMCIHGEM